MLEHSYSYHIYNHANGNDNLFIEKKNYPFFLKQYEKHVAPIANTHAYCLMPNHFHLLITIKTREEIELLIRDCLRFRDLQGLRNLEGLDEEEINTFISKFISQQFSNFFNSYSKAFNKAYNRRGSLFLKNFRRKLITSRSQMLNTLIYIHLNPVKHGFTSDFSNWEFTSFHEYMKPQPNQITKPTEMINGIFSTDNFKNLHTSKSIEVLRRNELE